MSRRSTTLRTLSASALLVLALAACGEAGSSGTGGNTSGGSTSTASGAACEPVAGDALVVLEDDKHLQTVDNIIPAANAAAVANQPAVLELLDTVSAALTTDKLIALNKAVDVERQTSSQVAQKFVEDEGLAAQDTPGTGTSLVVGAANFSESTTLAEIYAAVLRSGGYDVTVQTVDARETYLPALESGQLSVFPEYVGTLTEFLNKEINGPDAEPLASGDLDTTVAALRELGAQKGLTFGEPSSAQDQNAFAVTTAFAEEHDVSTLSELAEACPGGITLGAGPECPERAFCEPGLEEKYGLNITNFVNLDVGGPLTKAALLQGEIVLGLVFSSDGQLG
ncbi:MULTISPECIES: glycine betaine ABC transporter substrate-binding protein [Oerskovia]|uniref:Substrate binding domain of ABC-type glycine betaine transport system n=1 Tax=Oerskovia enterophila TaxID=43678 RepID=A0A163SRR9_9CELL|nr:MULTISPECIES: glycine betaine ABC transporter substrate-binding protein [Oerskovia]KRC37548.1 glycine/betaine ABC transporter substrate-binding protein [Oerskovia sp. Root22]KRD40309.1 glycine/betaine ABC transporter substrate-binding protein [Oerskovia sp. Root918]KZM36702.1 substrate binding domain of ABC-type glycine betaine transport system [Oerskovia enterophila]OCI31181.1 substrate binding domain of ABC-type glycine betaine transport system [Oerskovia enterophila]